ncbi:uncharacterized protein LOC130713256 [Lotus japonicus]|uniref:uncharacterized protein LOC130713256 n=1 Tax=Lotus japonicus TaxID=34305 RepID=UPI0025832E2A|nr:uncharacterized protein LOC130713256 [Lotus japonicus]
MSPTGSARVFGRSGTNGGRRWNKNDEYNKNPESNTGVTLFVDGLDDRVNYRQLRRALEKHGKVESAFLPRRRKNERRLRFGFIHFSNRNEGLKAADFWHRKKLNNAFLTVHPAKYPMRFRRSRKDKERMNYVGSLRNHGKRKQIGRQKENVEENQERKRPNIRREWRVKQKHADQMEKDTIWNQRRVTKNGDLQKLAIVSMKNLEEGKRAATGKPEYSNQYRRKRDVHLSGRMKALENLWQAYGMEESKWIQKARIKWIKEGDKNTAFFHRIHKTRREKQNISKLNIGAQDDVFALFADFHESGRVTRGMNAAFITLMPKQKEGNSISDFWPISLIGSTYKLIAKVLAARLQREMPKLITGNQFAFVPGRQIVDCISIANEIADLMIRKEEGGLLLKVDFAKAYDQVDWDFVINILHEMHFGDKWITWMKNCISTASLAVLVNGSPTDFFAIEKGLRQGDPLSSLLFNLCANGLSCLLNQLLGNENFSGIRVSENLAINHLQFADDTLLFCKNSELQLENICNMLISFLFASGLKVNYGKSMLIGCNIPELEVERLAALHGWSTGVLPIQYLGVPLGGNPRRVDFWKPVIEKLRCRSRNWNSKFISLSGRLVIIKSISCSIPMFPMSVFKAPKRIMAEIEKILRSFLWGSDNGRRRVNWIGWDQVCKNKEAGGLGLGFISWRNKALLLKWAWKYGTNINCLWRKIVIEKYKLDQNSLLLHNERISRGGWSKMMGDVFNVLIEDDLMSLSFGKSILVSVGDGKHTNFWNDPWTYNEPLRVSFPRIFALCDTRATLLAEVGKFHEGKWQWNLPFRRQFFDWEVAVYEDFVRTINSITPSVGENDSIVWCLNQSGIFNVRDACRWVEEQVFESEWQVPNTISKLVPPKVGLFVWQAQKNKIATKDNLRARGIDLNGLETCVFCNQVSETSSHLFLHCVHIWNLWVAIISREGFCWVIPKSLNQLLAEWDNLPRISDGTLWSLIPYSLLWSIWLERNGSCFSNKEINLDNIWEMHLLRIGWWIKALNKRNLYSLEHFARDFTNIRLQPRQKKMRNASWSLLVDGTMKVNVDGASKGNPGTRGIGGILRNVRNEIKGFFSKNIGHGFAFEAEVVAIHEALSLCQQHLIHNIIIESDSSLAVGWVNCRRNRPWKLRGILNQIDILIPLVNCLEIRHIFREANSEADALAKRGSNNPRPLYYFNSVIGV